MPHNFTSKNKLITNPLAPMDSFSVFSQNAAKEYIDYKCEIALDYAEDRIDNCQNYTLDINNPVWLGVATSAVLPYIPGLYILNVINAGFTLIQIPYGLSAGTVIYGGHGLATTASTSGTISSTIGANNTMTFSAIRVAASVTNPNFHAIYKLI